LIISEAGVAVKYNIYLHEHDVSLEFESTDRSRVELAALRLKLVGVNAEVKKKGRVATSGTSEPSPTSWRLGARSSEKPSPRSSRRLSKTTGWTPAGRSGG
jgi:hypothetical protein